MARKFHGWSFPDLVVRPAVHVEGMVRSHVRPGNHRAGPLQRGSQASRSAAYPGYHCCISTIAARAGCRDCDADPSTQDPQALYAVVHSYGGPRCVSTTALLLPVMTVGHTTESEARFLAKVAGNSPGLAAEFGLRAYLPGVRSNAFVESLDDDSARKNALRSSGSRKLRQLRNCRSRDHHPPPMVMPWVMCSRAYNISVDVRNHIAHSSFCLTARSGARGGG